MGIGNMINRVIDSADITIKRIEWKNKAKERYKSLNGDLAEKEPCSQCEGMAENISDGDTIVVIKRNSKKFCTEPWHETMGEVEKIDGAAKKMAYIGYNTSVAGFNLTKICPFCRRIISVKQF